MAGKRRTGALTWQAHTPVGQGTRDERHFREELAKLRSDIRTWCPGPGLPCFRCQALQCPSLVIEAERRKEQAVHINDRQRQRAGERAIANEQRPVLILRRGESVAAVDEVGIERDDVE